MLAQRINQYTALLSCLLVVDGLSGNLFSNAQVHSPKRQSLPLAKSTRRRFDLQIRKALAKCDWPENSVEKVVVAPSARRAVIVAANPPGVRDASTDDYDNLFLYSENSALQQLTPDFYGYNDVCFAPDERCIAYRSQEGRHVSIDGTAESPMVPWTVYRHDLAFNQRQVLFREQPSPYSSSQSKLTGWLPGTNALLYFSTRPKGAYLLPLHAPPRLLTSTLPQSALFSLERRRICWTTPGHITVARLPAQLALLARPATWRSLPKFAPFALPKPFPDHTNYIGYSPDNNQLALEIYADTPDGEPRRIVVLDLPTGQMYPLGTYRTDVFSVAGWSPDGRQIVFARRVSDRQFKYDRAVKVHNVPRQSGAAIAWTEMLPVHFVPYSGPVPESDSE